MTAMVVVNDIMCVNVHDYDMYSDYMIATVVFEILATMFKKRM